MRPPPAVRDDAHGVQQIVDRGLTRVVLRVIHLRNAAVGLARNAMKPLGILPEQRRPVPLLDRIAKNQVAVVADLDDMPGADVSVPADGLRRFEPIDPRVAYGSGPLAPDRRNDLVARPGGAVALGDGLASRLKRRRPDLEGFLTWHLAAP